MPPAPPTRVRPHLRRTAAGAAAAVAAHTRNRAGAAPCRCQAWPGTAAQRQTVTRTGHHPACPHRLRAPTPHTHPDAVDPALWTWTNAFGVAGGPRVAALTQEGRERAFAVGARVRRGAPAAALEFLDAVGGEGTLDRRTGARLTPTALGQFDQLAWGHLRERGYVESLHAIPGTREAGVRLTAAGRDAVARGQHERDLLLDRCRAAAAAERSTPR